MDTLNDYLEHLEIWRQNKKSPKFKELPYEQQAEIRKNLHGQITAYQFNYLVKYGHRPKEARQLTKAQASKIIDGYKTPFED